MRKNRQIFSHSVCLRLRQHFAQTNPRRCHHVTIGSFAPAVFFAPRTKDTLRSARPFGLLPSPLDRLIFSSFHFIRIICAFICFFLARAPMESAIRDWAKKQTGQNIEIRDIQNLLNGKHASLMTKMFNLLINNVASKA